MRQLSYMEKLLDGGEVEWKEISEIFHLKNGYTPSKSKTAFWENGDIPWFRMDDIRENGQILDDSLQKVSMTAIKGNNLFPADSIIMSTSATIGEHALVTVPFLANQRFTNLSLKPAYTDRFEIKFIFYYCFLLADWCKDNTTMSSFASVDMNGFRKFQIPIPPLNVQAEIVRILDTFTELTAELTAELVARKQQYDYYRKQLFIFNESQIELKLLGDVTVYEQPTKYRVDSKDYDDDFLTPVLTAGKTFILGYTNEVEGIYEASKTPVIIFDDFTTANKWVDFDFKVKSSAMKMVTSLDESVVMQKFIYYWLNTLPSELVDGDHKRHWISNFAKKEIPVPPLAEQQRIVAILDKFDALTTSLTEGLPREIALRQQQYEYYRELLLSFPKAEVVDHD